MGCAMYKFFNDLSTIGEFDVLFNDIDLDVGSITTGFSSLTFQSSLASFIPQNSVDLSSQVASAFDVPVDMPTGPAFGI